LLTETPVVVVVVVTFAELEDVPDEVEEEEEEVREDPEVVVMVIVADMEVAAAEETVVPALPSVVFWHGTPSDNASGGATKLLHRITLCSPPDVGS
jgi:hypothetical protein